jgi:hypothetical protein
MAPGDAGDQETTMQASSWVIAFALLVPAAECPAPPGDVLLRPGEKLVLRVRQVIPCDDLCPGERLLNGRPLLVAGDRFLAEILDNSCATGVLLGGTVTRVHPAGWFRRPGHVEIELVQLTEFHEGAGGPRALRIDLNDPRWRPFARRSLADFYFGFEGGDIGAAIGAQLAQGNIGLIMGGAGIGFVVGMGAAALVHGSEARLEPDDTFEITVGTCSYRPLPQTSPLKIYPPCVPVQR